VHRAAPFMAQAVSHLSENPITCRLVPRDIRLGSTCAYWGVRQGTLFFSPYDIPCLRRVGRVRPKFTAPISTVPLLLPANLRARRWLAWLAWPMYWFWQGAFATGVWVIAHECGHGAFSDSEALNDGVGLVFHSLLLVPYYSW
jgi:hypothetical protein